MIVTLVYITVKDDFTEEFIEITAKNHQHSVKEPGNLRFDFLRNGDNPNQFVLYEAYESENAARLHKETAHYLEWREVVADWMKEPRKGIRYEVVEPKNPALW